MDRRYEQRPHDPFRAAGRRERLGVIATGRETIAAAGCQLVAWAAERCATAVEGRLTGQRAVSIATGHRGHVQRRWGHHQVSATERISTGVLKQVQSGRLTTVRGRASSLLNTGVREPGTGCGPLLEVRA
jgi:hypothetical protein